METELIKAAEEKKSKIKESLKEKDTKKFISNFWAELPAFVKIIIVLIILFLVWRTTVKIRKYFEQKKQNDILENNKYNIKDENGNVYQIDLGGKASEIWNAFYNNDWFGATEDEEKALEVLNSVDVNLVTQLGNIYFNLYGKNMKSDFQRFLSTSQYNTIKHKFGY
jgi:hypothetical protein